MNNNKEKKEFVEKEYEDSITGEVCDEEQDTTDLEIQSSENEHLATVESTSNAVKGMVESVNRLEQTKNERVRLQNDFAHKTNKLMAEHNQVMTHMDKFYKTQNRTLDTADKVVDAGLESGNLDAIKAGLDAMLGTVKNKFESDKLKSIEKKIDDDDSDEDLELW